MARMTLEDIEKITGNPTKLTLQDIEKITGNPTVTQTSVPQRSSEKAQKIPSLSSNVGDPGYKKKSGSNLYIGETVGGDDVTRMAKKNKVGSYSSIRPENSARLRKSEPEEKEEAFSGRGSAQNDGVQDSSVGLRKSSNQTADNKQQSGSFDESRLDEYAEPSYKLNAQEQKEAKKFIQDYYKNTPGLSGGILKAVENARQRANWSEEEQEKYEKVVALENKLSSGSAIMAGIAGAFDTFTAPLEKMAQNVTKSFTGEDTDVEGKLEEQMEGTKRQHPIASTAGNIGGQMAKYAMGSTLAGQIPALGKAANTIGRTAGGAAEKALSGVGGKLAGVGSGAVANVGGKLLSGGAKRIGEQVARSASNIAGDMTLDLALDTIPRISENAREGMSAGEIAADAGRNIAQNLGWNVLGEAGGVAMERIPEISQYFRRRNGSGTGTVDTPKGTDVSNPLSVADEAKVKGGSAQINSNAENVTQKVAKNAVPTNRKETVSEKEILNIINDENLRRTFTEQTGVQLSGSRDDMAKTIRETLSDSFGPKEVAAMDRANAADITAENTARRAAEIESGKRSALDELKKNLSEYNMSDENRKRASSLLDEMSKIQNRISAGKDSTPVYEQLIEKSAELDRLLRETATRTTVDEFSKKAYDDVVSYLRSTGKSIYVSPKAAAEFPDGVRSLNQQFSSYGRGISFTTNREKGIPLDTIMGDMEQLTGFRGSGNDIDDLKNLTEYLARNKAGRTVQEPYTGGAVSEFIENATKPFNAAMDMSDLTSSGNPLKVSKTRTNTLPKSGLLTETEMARYMPEDVYRYISVSEKESMSEAALRISVNAEGWKQRIMAQDELSGKDVDTLMMLYKDTVEKARQSNDETYWTEARTLLKKVQESSTKSGQEIQALAKWSNHTPEGAVMKAQKVLNDRAIALEVDNPKLSKDIKSLSESLTDTANRIFDNEINNIENPEDLLPWGGIGVGSSPEIRTSAYSDEAIAKLRSQVENVLKKSRIKKSVDSNAVDHITKMLQKGSTANDIAEALEMFESTGSFGLTDEMIDKVYTLFDEAEKYGEFSKQRADIESQAYALLASQVGKSSFMDKWDAWRYMAMLGNTRTHVRNIIGNQMFGAVTNIKDGLAAVMEGVADKVSRRTGGNGIGRTKTIRSVFDRKLIQAGKEDAVNNVYSLLNDGNKYSNVYSGIESEKRIFKNNLLEKFRKFNSNMLDKEDFFALKNKYANALAGYLKANGADETIFQKTDALSQSILRNARAYAIKEAQEATFHEANAAASAISQLSRNMKDSGTIKGNLGYMALEGLVPFKKTPLNIVREGVRYSPASLLTGTVDLINAVRKGNKSASEAIDKLAKGMTGTGLMALGGWLASQDVLKSSGDSDSNMNFYESGLGNQNYSIQAGNHNYTIDWAAPAALPLFVGAELYKAMSEKGISTESFFNSLSSISEPILETTMLSGLNDVLDTISNSDDVPGGKIAAIAGTTMSSYITQAIPTLSGQIARSVDDARRDTYSDKTGTAGSIDKALNKVQNKIPALSQYNEAYIDHWGEEEKNAGGNLWGRLAYNMLSPGYYANTSQISDIDREIKRLYQETGNAKVAPSSYVTSVNVEGAQKRLTEKEHEAVARDMGQTQRQLLEQIMATPTYQKMSDDDKANTIADIYDLSKAIAADKNVDGFENSSRLFKVYKESGLEGVVDYVALDKAAEQFKSADGSSKTFAGATQSEKMEILDQQDMTPEEKGAYMYSSTDSKAVKNTFEEYGNEGVWNYYKAKQAADPDGSGSFSADAAMSYLDQQGYSDEEKGFYMYQLGKEGKTRDRFYSGKGYEGVYDYYKIRSEADYNGNGNLAQSEVIPYLSSEDFPREVKRLYFSWLFPNAKENPF